MTTLKQIVNAENESKSLIEQAYLQQAEQIKETKDFLENEQYLLDLKIKEAFLNAQESENNELLKLKNQSLEKINQISKSINESTVEEKNKVLKQILAELMIL